MNLLTPVGCLGLRYCSLRLPKISLSGPAQAVRFRAVIPNV